MKIPVALTMLASPFSLPHNERWVLPIALGFFTLLTVYFTWRLKTDEGDKWLFRKKMKVSALFWLACEVLWQFHGADSTFPVGPITGHFVSVPNESGAGVRYLLHDSKEKNNSCDVSGFPIKIVLEAGRNGRERAPTRFFLPDDERRTRMAENEISAIHGGG